MMDVLFIVFLIGLVIILPIAFIIIAESYNKKVKSGGEQHKFEYLDTFFYRFDNSKSESSGMTAAYNIVLDLDNKKVYAIPLSSFKGVTLNMALSKKISLIKQKGSKIVDIKFGDTGIFYLDRITDNKLKDEDFIYEKFDLKKAKKFQTKKPYMLFNLNSKYDMSILDDAVFAVGLAEFDEK